VKLGAPPALIWARPVSALSVSDEPTAPPIRLELWRNQP
jgi:hypothetical protein